METIAERQEDVRLLGYRDMELEIKDLVAALSYRQLIKLQFDLSHGSIMMRKMIDARIRELETTNKPCCATCGKDIAVDEHNYTIVFGPSDFRKKATCCGMDCFDAFMKKLKQYEDTVTR